MSQRKLIVSLCVAVLLAITAGVSQGSVSRMEGMGLNVPTLSQFTDDYANIYWYPTSVVRQNNLVLAEIGNNPTGDVNPVETLDQSYTVIRNFPKIGAIAFKMAQSQNNVFTASGNLNNDQLDLIWGKALSALDFAVRVDATNSYFTRDTNAPSSFEARGFSAFDPGPVIPGFVAIDQNAIVGNPIEINTWGVTPSVALHFGQDDRLEVAGTYRRFTFNRDATPGTVSWKDGGNPSYGILARAILHRGGTHTWFPAGWYVNDDLSWEMRGVLANTITADETYKSYGVGISDNMRVNDNNLLLWGATFGQNKHSYERTDANTGGPAGSRHTFTDKTTAEPLVFAAVETDATKWLKLRIGASRGHMVSRTESADFAAVPNTSTTKTRTSDFNLGIGTGIRWNNLDIDMTLNQQFPLSGGWVLSGNQQTPFNRVSATYHF
ncbi:MAG TPA: hypothetical protein VK123_07655 [Candidatus Limnocylindrales bacterium]|nr:hypothetical protein [Candidatus Limnocylindrales bacterium]